MYTTGIRTFLFHCRVIIYFIPLLAGVMAAGPIAERNQDATIYVGGLDEKVSETLLWELFLEAGPVGWYSFK